MEFDFRSVLYVIAFILSLAMLCVCCMDAARRDDGQAMAVISWSGILVFGTIAVLVLFRLVSHLHYLG